MTVAMMHDADHATGRKDGRLGRVGSTGRSDMHTRRMWVALGVCVMLLPACGKSSDDGNKGTSTRPPETSTTSAIDRPGQPAIWPAAGVVFETPEEAAEDFVSRVLGVPPVLGEFQQGDARSGEIEVFSPGEGMGAKSGVSRPPAPAQTRSGRWLVHPLRPQRQRRHHHAGVSGSGCARASERRRLGQGLRSQCRGRARSWPATPTPGSTR